MKKITLATLASALLSVSVWGQGPPGGPHHRGFGPELGIGMHSGKLVTGAPYSATVTNSDVQTLPDSNTIQHTTNGSVARDSQGRTYEQVTFSGSRFGQSGPTTLIFINDPVAGFAYSLNPTTKVASSHALKTPAAGQHPRGPRGEGGPDVVTTDLGSQTIGGVTATGKSITHTVPAGAMGNAQPIVITSEVWTSPDLQIPVLAKRTDPRFGQSTYSLTNIQRAEPAASLFQVPSDYTVKAAPEFGGPGGHSPQQ